MAPERVFEILYTPMIRQHLNSIERKYYSLIRDAIKEQLDYAPDRESRNKKPLKRPVENGAQWELRCGPNNRFRIFYTVDRERKEVIILAIGEKLGNRLLMGGEEIDL